MAYQPKSYRKFVATAATATLVASAFAPLASAADASKFKDVPESYKEAVEFVVLKGANGKSETQFGTHDNITRVEAGVLLVKVLGLDIEKAPASGFTDVNPTYAKHINALKAAGITSGKSTTKFGAYDEITRGELAKWIAKGFELKGTSDKVFSDVNESYKAAVSALVAAGVTNGINETQFGTNNNAKRGDYAKFLFRAANPAPSTEVLAIEADGKDKITLKLKGEVKEVKASDFKFDNGLEVKEAKVVKAPAAAADEVTTTVELTTSTQTPGAKYTLQTLFGVKPNGKVSVDIPAVVNPAVESVSAINAKQLVVEFNKAVSADSVITTPGTTNTLEAGVVSVLRTSTTAHGADVDPALAGYAASLSEDGKTLTITAPSAKFFAGNYDVAVKNVVSGNDKLENYYSKFTADDSVAPLVTGVSYNQKTDKFEVTLSEPIDSLNGQVVRVNGNPIAFDAITAPTKKLTFARGNVAFGSNATLYIAGLKDAAGNLLNSYNGTISATEDASALSVASITQVSNTKARVTFNKALDSASVAKITGPVASNGLVVSKPDGTVTQDYTVVAAPAAVNPDGNVYEITFNEATYASSNSHVFTVTFTAEAFKGITGNKNALHTAAVTLNKDVTAPTVSSTVLNYGGTKLEVTVSEDVDAVSLATGVSAGKVKLRKDGAELTGVSANVKPGTTNVIEVVTTDVTAVSSGKLKSGSYTVRFETGAFTDLSGVSVAATNTGSVSVGSTPSQPLNVVLGQGGTNTFTVTAPAGQTFTTASLSASNFTVDGVAVPATSDITLNPDRDVITVKLPTVDSVKFSGSALFAVNGLTLQSGTALNNAVSTLAVTDNTAATLTGARLLGDSLELTFDEALESNYAPADIAALIADFEIKGGTTALTAGTTDAVVGVVSGNKITLTITGGDSNWSTVKAASTVTVETDSPTSALDDANGVIVRDNVKVTVAK